MDKWTYRQLYRCAVGGNARAREHWKRSGVDPHQKIDAKYSSMTAAQYKTSLEKDVADMCRQGLGMLAAQLRLVNEQILDTDRLIRTNARSTEVGRRLMEIPGVGPLLASALVGTIADPKAFKTGRNLAAWIGLVPKQNSSGGKERLGGITKQGDRYLRQMLVVGALAVVRYAVRNGTRRPWLVQLLARRTPKVAAVALANKTARMVWAIMTSGERYREPIAA